jgi:hypothetical protein
MYYLWFFKNGKLICEITDTKRNTNFLHFDGKYYHVECKFTDKVSYLKNSTFTYDIFIEFTTELAPKGYMLAYISPTASEFSLSKNLNKCVVLEFNKVSIIYSYSGFLKFLKDKNIELTRFPATIKQLIIENC